MNRKVFSVILLALFVMAVSIDLAYACRGFDQPCEGENGTQANCCSGMHCQKNNPSWAQGRCYYNPGK